MIKRKIIHLGCGWPLKTSRWMSYDFSGVDYWPSLNGSSRRAQTPNMTLKMSLQQYTVFGKIMFNPHTNMKKKTRVFEYAGSARTPIAFVYHMKAMHSLGQVQCCGRSDNYSLCSKKFCRVRADPAYSYEG